MRRHWRLLGADLLLDRSTHAAPLASSGSDLLLDRSSYAAPLASSGSGYSSR